MACQQQTFRVLHHPHHRGQLCRHVHGHPPAQRRQDNPGSAAGKVISPQLYVKLIAAFTGGAGALLYGNLHSGDVHQDCCHGLCPPPRLLSQERLEHHGFHRGRLWFSAHVDAKV